MTWREHIAAVLGAVAVLAVLAAVASRPLIVALSQLDMPAGFSSTVAKTPTALRDK